MMAETTDFRRLFEPQSIAVIGASATAGGVANNFLRNLRTQGFPGRVYAVHPSAATIEGWPAFPAIDALPEPIDYAYVSVAAARTPALLRAAAGRIRFAQVIASGFGEADEAALEAELVAACRGSRIRLIGPNCLGLYSSRGRVSFISDVQMEPGGVSVASQSGGLGADILRRGQMRGLRFNGLVTLGNSVDLGPVDLLRYMLDDPDTQVVGLYLEDVKDGRHFFQALRAAGGRKPVVILNGGRTAAGQRASASHTGALAQDHRLWQAVARQTGVVLVDTLDRLLDALLAFQHLLPHVDRPTANVVLFGNGGGTSVLASDAFSRAGFTIPVLGDAARAQLKAMQLPPGSTIDNPIDTPAGALRQEGGTLGGRILAAITADPSIDAIIMHLNMPVILAYSDPDILPNLIKGALDARTQRAERLHFLLVLRSDGELEIEAEKQRYRAAALALGVPVFNELADAADALACIATHERFLHEQIM